MTFQTKQRKPLKRSGFKPCIRPTEAERPYESALSLKTAPASPGKRESGLQRSSKPLSPIGKKGSEWIKVRAWLKRHFNFAGITYCEARLAGCHFDNMLSFAHCKKRRKLLEGEIYHVALLCFHCHDVYERMSHEDMHEGIHKLIDRRGLIAPPR